MNYRKVRSLIAGLAIACGLGFNATAAIVVDGNTQDWATIQPLSTAAAQSVSSLKASVEDGALFVLVEGTAVTSYNLFLGVEAAGGARHLSSLWPGPGFEFLFSNGALYRATGSGWSWQPVAGVTATAASASAVELKIPLSALGVANGKRISLAVQSLTPTWQTAGALPALGTAMVSIVAPATNPTEPRGVIIPAYLSLDDAVGWNVLKEGAALMSAGKGRSARDYWLTVNSGSNGPFATAAEWQRAALAWNPVRANGGKIFGYVHTCVQPEGPTFRPLADVKKEIADWVRGYPALDGIWLDEYYPRFEIAPTETVVGPTYPNGLANAPTDRGFVNGLNQFNGQQVIVAGGYYDQLTAWIRANYPGLKIIGNAGGAFYSNQLKYADLVDVLVSFEQTYANAAANDWKLLNRQVTASPASQLALIHGNDLSLDGAIEQAFAHGYSYVFTTNRQLGNNIWGGLPPYFTSEIQYLANRP
jgi:Spherulation-specific family 4